METKPGFNWVCYVFYKNLLISNLKSKYCNVVILSQYSVFTVNTFLPKWVKF